MINDMGIDALAVGVDVGFIQFFNLCANESGNRSQKRVDDKQPVFGHKFLKNVHGHFSSLSFLIACSVRKVACASFASLARLSACSVSPLVLPSRIAIAVASPSAIAALTLFKSRSSCFSLSASLRFLYHHAVFHVCRCNASGAKRKIPSQRTEFP